jgi:Glycosyltransferase sugar-binding region containing DXD motif/Alpha 1,4-glycosyltransferase conserved region
MNKMIQGLWIGAELSVMEQLSISSFLRNGHEYHLYVYDKVKNIPVGTVVKDAGEILPASRIFQYRLQASYSGFSNFFRYKLLLERGGWWSDMDIICLQPFDFPEDYVFATEVCDGLEVVSSGIIKAPIGSEAMGHAWDVCQTKDPEKLLWGETGPKLAGETVKKYSLERYVKSHDVFCPLGYLEWHRVLEPEPVTASIANSHAIHLWNWMWKSSGQEKNARYPNDCLYEKLKRRYLDDA